MSTINKSGQHTNPISTWAVSAVVLMLMLLALAFSIALENFIPVVVAGGLVIITLVTRSAQKNRQPRGVITLDHRYDYELKSSVRGKLEEFDWNWEAYLELASGLLALVLLILSLKWQVRLDTDIDLTVLAFAIPMVIIAVVFALIIWAGQRASDKVSPKRYPQRRAGTNQDKQRSVWFNEIALFLSISLTSMIFWLYLRREITGVIDLLRLTTNKTYQPDLWPILIYFFFTMLILGGQIRARRKDGLWDPNQLANLSLAATLGFVLAIGFSIFGVPFTLPAIAVLAILVVFYSLIYGLPPIITKMPASVIKLGASVITVLFLLPRLLIRASNALAQRLGKLLASLKFLSNPLVFLVACFQWIADYSFAWSKYLESIVDGESPSIARLQRSSLCAEANTNFKNRNSFTGKKK